MVKGSSNTFVRDRMPSRIVPAKEPRIDGPRAGACHREIKRYMCRQPNKAGLRPQRECLTGASQRPQQTTRR